jgi:hypothetical protein
VIRIHSSTWSGKFCSSHPRAARTEAASRRSGEKLEGYRSWASAPDPRRHARTRAESVEGYKAASEHDDLLTRDGTGGSRIPTEFRWPSCILSAVDRTLHGSLTVHRALGDTSTAFRNRRLAPLAWARKLGSSAKATTRPRPTPSR